MCFDPTLNPLPKFTAKVGPPPGGWFDPNRYSRGFGVFSHFLLVFFAKLNHLLPIVVAWLGILTGTGNRLCFRILSIPQVATSGWLLRLIIVMQWGKIILQQHKTLAKLWAHGHIPRILSCTIKGFRLRSSAPEFCWNHLTSTRGRQTKPPASINSLNGWLESALVLLIASANFYIFAVSHSCLGMIKHTFFGAKTPHGPIPSWRNWSVFLGCNPPLSWPRR